MYSRILVPIDGSAASDAGLAEAIRLAGLSGGTLKLLHLHVQPPYLPEAEEYGQFPADRARVALERAAAMVAERADRVRAAGVEVLTTFIHGDERKLTDIVAQAVADWPAELVVMGTHGRRGLGRLVLGSDAEAILRRSEVPVMLVRQRDRAEHAGSSESSAHAAQA